MHVYFLFFQVASATATRYGLSRGPLNLKFDEINNYDSDSDNTTLVGLPGFTRVSKVND